MFGNTSFTNESFIRGIAWGWIRVSWDKVNNLRHDDIVVKILELGDRPNKAGNVIVYARLETRISKIVHHRLSHIRWHIAVSSENATEDKSKVYNVRHHEADILFAKEMVDANHILQEKRTHLFS